MLPPILALSYQQMSVINFKLNIGQPVHVVQSTLVILNWKGPSETFRDIRTSTYQMCRIEENTNRTTKFHK